MSVRVKAVEVRGGNASRLVFVVTQPLHCTRAWTQAKTYVPHVRIYVCLSGIDVCRDQANTHANTCVCRFISLLQARACLVQLAIDREVPRPLGVSHTPHTALKRNASICSSTSLSRYAAYTPRIQQDTSSHEYDLIHSC